jgi:hypothetical protein
VLARLEALEDVDHAFVDHSGDLLRLSLRDEHAITAAIALLSELGYGAERASDADVRAVTIWYDTTSVGDLSRVEAGVIADRIVPSFAEARKLSAPATSHVRSAVVDALHVCFISNALASGPSLGEFRLSCEGAVEDAVRPIVGREPARELAALLNTDMSQDHRGR